MKLLARYPTRTGAGGIASLGLLSWAACWGTKGRLARPKAREGVAPGPNSGPGPNNGTLAMRSEGSEGLHEATKALTVAIVGLLAISLISNLVLLLLY